MNDYLDFAKDLAYRAGDIMLEHFQVGVAKQIKSDATPVTEADIAINKLVIDSVAGKFPGHTVMGEEDSSTSEHAEYVWVCDPIDGTIPYTLGVPTNMFSLALVRDGVSIVGVLYDPHSKRMYEATIESKTLLNGQPIQINTEGLPQGYVAMPLMQYGITDTAALVQDAVSSGLRSLSFCSTTYEAALVASGQISGAVFPGVSPWDIAAVKVIVEGAGGKVTDVFGNEQRYDKPIKGAISSNGVVHDQLVALVSKYVKS